MEIYLVKISINKVNIYKEKEQIHKINNNNHLHLQEVNKDHKKKIKMMMMTFINDYYKI
jgi:hypothetical protein